MQPVPTKKTSGNKADYKQIRTVMTLAKVYAELPIKESVSLSSLIEEGHYIYD